jgi:hypothetical protein
MSRMLLRSVLTTGALLSPALALAQVVSIEHQGVGCVVAGKFPRFDARLDPVGSVARARLNFRPEGSLHWYFVDMKPEAGLFHGVLPKPQKSLHRFSYYIDVTDKAFHASRTAEFTPDVASGPAACGREKVLAAGLTKANVLLHAPEGVVGAPAVPAGFAADGVVTASGAGTTAATTGGIGAKAVILGTVLAAGGAAAVIATTSGDESSAGPSPPPTTPAGPPPTPAPAPTPSPAANLSGTWVGNWPTDGLQMTFVGCGFCTNTPTNQGSDAVLNLSQSGNSLSGDGTGTVRDAPPAGCPAEPNCNWGPVGNVTPFSVAGTVNGTSVTMQLTGTAPGQGGTFLIVLSGTVAGNRMSGAATFTSTNSPSGSGTWSLNLQ